MRHFFLLIIFTCSVSLMHAQEIPADVWVEYYGELKPAEKGKILRKFINFRFQGTETEKLALLFNTRRYFLERNDQVGLDYTDVLISIYSWRIGDYHKSIQEGLQVLPRFEQRRDTFGMFYTINSIAIASVDARSSEQAMTYMKKALSYASALQDTGGVITIYNNIADLYFKNNRPDSALFFIKEATARAEEYYRLSGESKIFLLTLTLSTYGDVLLARGDHATARTYINRALQASAREADTASISYNYSNLSHCFYEQQQYDSALYYAQQALLFAQPLYRPEMLKAYEWIYKSYKAGGQVDSVFHYFSLAMNLKDTIYSLEKTQNIQRLNFQEQLREQEIADREAQRIRENRRNAQYMGIFIFILTLVIFVFLLRRKKPDLKTIEYLGMLAVLLLFEFLSMILHPFIERITHHNAILMLLCLVCIGAVIAPLHHKLTEYVKRRNRQVQHTPVKD